MGPCYTGAHLRNRARSISHSRNPRRTYTTERERRNGQLKYATGHPDAHVQPFSFRAADGALTYLSLFREPRKTCSFFLHLLIPDSDRILQDRACEWRNPYDKPKPSSRWNCPKCSRCGTKEKVQRWPNRRTRTRGNTSGGIAPQEASSNFAHPCPLLHSVRDAYRDNGEIRFPNATSRYARVHGSRQRAS